jgi:hypothetical protein
MKREKFRIGNSLVGQIMVSIILCGWKLNFVYFLLKRCRRPRKCYGYAAFLAKCTRATITDGTRIGRQLGWSFSGSATDCTLQVIHKETQPYRKIKFPDLFLALASAERARLLH